ncbi:PEGA domain-containing protein [Patescibacteria group bacterium]|nr:PEGA domain-containing protein [Patescibacteria group bacterium]
MSISTLQNKKKGLPTPVVYVLGIVGVGLIVYFGGEILRNLGNLKGKSSVNIESGYGSGEVYINGEMVGNTPYRSQEITPGENTIEIKHENRSYQTSLTFLPNTNTYLHHVGINRDLGVSDYFSAGNEFWFEEDSSNNILRIVSEPSGASVYIDGNEVGKTPFLANNLTEGDYDLRIEEEGFESQEARINVKSGYTLNITVKLFPAPVPAKVSSFEDSPNLYELSSDNPLIVVDTQTWAKAVVHWNRTRGIDLKGIGVSKELLFDYFLDYRGNIYDQEGVLVSNETVLSIASGSAKGAYLGRKADGEGLTPEAKQALETIMGAEISAGKNVTIKPTATGWLRVRDTPSLSGAEVTTVNVGSTYALIEEAQEWVKIKIDENTQGWVYKTYVDISE